MAVSALGWAGLAGLGPARLCEMALFLGAMARPSHAARPFVAERCVVKGSSCGGYRTGSLKGTFLHGPVATTVSGPHYRIQGTERKSLAQPVSIMFRQAQHQIPYSHPCNL